MLGEGMGEALSAVAYAAGAVLWLAAAWSRARVPAADPVPERRRAAPALPGMLTLGALAVAGLVVVAPVRPMAAAGLSLALVLVAVRVSLGARAGRRAEAALALSEARHRGIVQGAADGIITLDDGGLIRSMNPAAERIFGREEADALGQPATLLMPAEASGAHRRRLDALTRGRRLRTLGAGLETVAVRPDGTEVPILLSLSVTPAGGATVTTGLVRDLSDLHEAEAALLAAEAAQRSTAERLQAVLSAAVEFAIVATDHAGTVTVFSAGAERMLGWQGEEVVGRTTLRAILDPRDGALESGEREVLTRTGERVPVALTVSPILDDAGRAVGTIAVAQDVTERRRAERAVRESERRFRALVTSAPVGILLTDARGRALFANERWTDLTGGPAVLTADDGWLSAVHEDDREEVVAGWAAAVAGERDFVRELRIRRADGTVAWVSAQAVPLRDEHGAVSGYIGSFVDMTDRRHAEELLHREHERLAAVMAATGEGLLVVSSEGDILDVNDRFLELTGFYREEIVGSAHPYPHWPPDSAAQMRDIWARVRSGALVEEDIEVARADGSVFPAAATYRTMASREGVPGGHVVSVADITARKEAERRLAESERSFRLLAEHASDLVTRAGDDGILMYVSPSSARILGIPPETLLGEMGLDDLLHPDDLEAVAGIRATLADPAGPDQADWVARHATHAGGWVWLETVARAVRAADGRVLEVHTSSRDVTERTRSQREDAALQLVASAVAHEAPPAEVFALVAELAAGIFDAPGGRVTRIEGPGAGVVAGSWSAEGVGARPPGSVVVLPPDDVVSMALAADGPVRVERTPGPDDAVPFVCVIAAPVRVGGAAWGTLGVGAMDVRVLPAGSEARLQRFADLVGTAIASAQSKADLERLARVDDLTGLPNQREFHGRLASEIARSGRSGAAVCLAIFDVDHFKRVNDTYGHPVGDLVLREVARRLRSVVRQSDVVARAGGEEFAWIMPDTLLDDAERAAARGRAAVSAEPFPQVGKVTISCGVAARIVGDDPESLYAAADEALYAAKQGGRDRVCTNPRQDAPAEDAGWGSTAEAGARA
jgi:diguanylate cyclase (GGDEF)-like protein/PAS domain S-box-containing protein